MIRYNIIYILPSILYIFSVNFHRLDYFDENIKDSIYYTSTALMMVVINYIIYKFYLKIEKRKFSIPLRVYLLIFTTILFIGFLKELLVMFSVINIESVTNVSSFFYMEWLVYGGICLFILLNINKWKFDNVHSDKIEEDKVYLMFRKPSLFSIFETIYSLFSRRAFTGYKFYCNGISYGFHNKEQHVNEHKVNSLFNIKFKLIDNISKGELLKYHSKEKMNKRRYNMFEYNCITYCRQLVPDFKKLLKDVRITE